MNLKTTIFIAIVAGACVLLFWKGPELAPRLHLAPKPVEISNLGTGADLDKIAADKIVSIKIWRPEGSAKPDKTLLVLAVPKGGKALELPGNWPVRRYEVNELISALSNLKTRFQPVPLAADADLKPFGLDPSQHPISVKVELADGQSHLLQFGQEEVKDGQNPFLRPTFVRMDGKNELLRLGPEMMQLLGRSEENYRRRQLFPEVERLKIAGTPSRNQEAVGSTVMLLGDQAKRVIVEGPAGKFALERIARMPQPIVAADKPGADLTVSPDQIAQSWALVEPVRDRIDPAKLRIILAAIPELIVQTFDEKAVPWFKTGLAPKPLEQFLNAMALAMPPAIGGEGAATAALALEVYSAPPPPEAKLTVVLDDGTSRTLYIGAVARSTQRIETEPPMFPGQPPQQRRMGETFMYARLGDNPFIFELKDDRLKELFVIKSADQFPDQSKAIDQLRDPTVARFDVAQVNRVDVKQAYLDSSRKPSERRFELVKIKGDASAEDAKARDDRWELVEPIKEPADTASVTELLEALKGMEARKENIVDGPGLPQALVGGVGDVDPKLLLGLTPEMVKKVTLTFDDKSGLKPVTFLLGARDPSTNKRAVMVEGWNRINIVDDRVENQHVSKFDRQPSSYRTLKLFDPGASKIGDIIVQRPATEKHPADAYTLQEQPGNPPKWSIAAPFKAEADSAAANALAAEAGSLATQKYVYDPKTDEPFTIRQWPPLLESLGMSAPAGDAIFGLDSPTLTLTFKFAEPKGAEDVVIDIGRARSATEYYARRKGSSGIFLVLDRVVKAADQKAEDLVDKTLIRLGSKPDVQTIRRLMAGQEFEIVQSNSALWEIAKPAPAKADQVKIDRLAQQLSQLRALRIAAVVPKSLAEFGLEPPVATVTVEALEKNKLVSKGLLVGNPVDPKFPQGERYVKAQDSLMVAVLSGDIARELVADPQKFRDLSIAGFVTADKIVMERGDRKITFQKEPSGWKVTEPFKADAEDQDLRELHDQLARLRADEMVEDKPKDLAKYGLDKPIRWHIFNGDRPEMDLLVGALEKIGPDKTEGLRRYAKLDKGDTVFLLDSNLSRLLSSEYRKKAVWDSVPPQLITEVSVKAPNPTDSFTFVKAPLGWVDAAKPGEKLNEELVTDLLLGMGSLRVERYIVDMGADLAKYGLDKPRVVTITMKDGKKHSLLLGNLPDGKRLYAKVDDPARTDVFLLDETDTLSLNRPPAEYVVKKKEETPKK